MHIAVLGPLTVENGGRPVPVGAPKVQQVLACLVAAFPRPVSVESLVDDLWPSSPPATAAHVVSTYLSRLRPLLGERLHSAGAHHRLVLGPDDSVDADQLGRSVERARSRLASDPAGVYATLTEVAPEPDAIPYDGLAGHSPRLMAEASRLTDLVLTTTRLRAEALLAMGRSEEAEQLLSAACRRHPYREPVHALHMLALYRQGRQAEALTVYRELRARLVNELGLEPTAEVRAMQDRILLHDPSLHLAPLHRLPTAPHLVVGRADALATLDALLDEQRLVTLLGPGGIGKSTLALTAAHAKVPRFPGGTWWVDLVAVSSAPRLMDRVRADIGIPAAPGVPDRDVVTTFLADRRALVVLDNCEHLLPDLAEDVAKLLAAAPDLAVLTTSRVPLSIDDEYVVPVGPLASRDAHALFLARATRARAQSWDPTIVDEICASVDNVPLAVELAAAQGRLEGDGRWIGKEADGPRTHHHATMADTIAWSHRLLAQPARATFDRCCVFAGSFDVSAAGAVTGVEPDLVSSTLDALVDASVLGRVPDPGNMRYRILQPLRHFGRQQLRDAGLVEEVAARHARHHLDLARAAGQDRLTPAFAPWVDRLHRVEPDLTVALDWALNHLPTEDVAAAAPGLFEYWFRRGDAGSAYEFGTRVLLRDGVALPPEHEAAARLCAGLGGVFVGDIESATTGLDVGIALLEGSDDWRGQLWAVLGRGQNATVFGDYATSEACGHRVLEICRRHGADLASAYGHALLGEAEFLGGGDPARALRHIEPAIDGFRELGDDASLNLFGLGIAAAICVRLGDLERAEAYATEAATLPGPGWRATALIILGGWVLHARGELLRAHNLVLRGSQQAREMSLEPWARHGCLMLARIAADRGDAETAARLFGAATPQPPWGSDPHWWTPRDAVAAKLGCEEFDELVHAGATTPLVDVLASLDLS